MTSGAWLLVAACGVCLMLALSMVGVALFTKAQMKELRRQHNQAMTHLEVQLDDLTRRACNCAMCTNTSNNYLYLIPEEGLV